MTTPAASRPIATSAPPRRAVPELLAPAGDRESLTAAIANGADAVYFGLEAHNARARAANFTCDELPEIMASLHQRGVRGYVTLNTLIFTTELAEAERLVHAVVEAGVDALIVQDLGLCRLAREIAPDLELHASTQMSITSAESLRLARELGCSRVILARELSLTEIARVRQAVDLPVEVFVHGALCVAYSGQCLTSEALGGRSANRGECAQACRMPYRLICDGQPVDLGEAQYLLSPQDLAAHEQVEQLMELGVASLKIEGRLKSPLYVASATASYRRLLDDLAQGHRATLDATGRRELELTFSRGLGPGFLEGNNHKKLVPGLHAKHRGLCAGRVVRVEPTRVVVALDLPLQAGDGVVLDADPAHGLPEQGGRVYAVHPLKGQGGELGHHALEFGRNDLDLRQVGVGQRLWKTDDPALERRIRQSYSGKQRRRVRLDCTLRAVAGQPLELQGLTATGLRASVRGDTPLPRAEKLPATADSLRRQLDRLGDTPYELGSLDVELVGDPLVPTSVLNALRRDLVAALDALAATPQPRPTRPGALDRLLAEIPRPAPDHSRDQRTCLAVLCRDEPQVAAALACGPDAIYLDFADVKRYEAAVSSIRDRLPAALVALATPRIQKPGEANLFSYLARQGADALLVRNPGGLYHAADAALPFIVDFAMNAANPLAMAWLMDKRPLRITPSYDLNFEQLDDLIQAVPPAWLEIVIHQHMPLFHMEHCVFCAFLSPGTDHTNCGRPCDRHDVRLEDRVGLAHPLTADVGCRNTLYHATPQTAAQFLPKLKQRGITWLRIEFVDESPTEAERVVRLYQAAIGGQRPGHQLWKDLKAINRYGVTRGQLAVLEND